MRHSSDSQEKSSGCGLFLSDCSAIEMNTVRGFLFPFLFLFDYSYNSYYSYFISLLELSGMLRSARSQSRQWWPGMYFVSISGAQSTNPANVYNGGFRKLQLAHIYSFQMIFFKSNKLKSINQR